MIWDALFHFFLAFSHATIVIPLVIIGYILIDRKIFFQVICLILLSILYTWALKVSFQIPLSPTLGKVGFAFPSGHMLLSLVLYGWLLKATNNKVIKIIFIILLIGIAGGLLYFGYHNIFDILGALFFGLLLMFIYDWLVKKYFKGRYFYLILLMLATVLVGYISFIYQMKPYIWQAYYFLIGVIIFDCILKRYKN